MTDPLLRLVATLPSAAPARDRADRTKSRCHAALERQRRVTETDRSKPHPHWAPAAVSAGATGVTRTIRQILRLDES